MSAALALLLASLPAGTQESEPTPPSHAQVATDAEMRAAASTSTLSRSDCTFLSNDVFCGHGGAMHLASCRTTLVDRHFEDNTAYLDGRLGGAIYLGGEQITMTGGTFDSNRGAALALLGEATLNGVTFTDNLAPAGQTWHFQAWFRDTWGGRTTSNSSEAVSVTFQ